MNKSLLPLLLLLSLSFVSYSQPEKKKVPALPLTGSIKIDGVLDEAAWQDAPVATSFVQNNPYNGSPATLETEVRFLYDNTGLYVGALMHDPHPDSILTELGLRDASDLNADWFQLLISPYNDGLNAFCFQVYASDVQMDFKLPNLSQSGGLSQDVTWDAVWQSKVRITKEGWVLEMKIPYSAIRFPKTDIQEWGINMEREIRRKRETDAWNFIDFKVQGVVNQSGLLEGIHNIKPPLRLSVSPYFSTYLDKSASQKVWLFSYKYGADLKYGINQSFTLDMTLIPDFGQAPTDDIVYNFSPFEIQYAEKRQFFTEGTELFNKSGIFYSRRVGGQPKGYDSAAAHLAPAEKVINNPSTTNVINATKISGRTSGGLGIGIFNAMSSNTWATIQDTVTGETRRFLTQGFTNYNMIVFDQNLKNNSYFDVLNTNYFMPTEGYTCNVSGIDYKFANKKYTYGLFGDGFVSQKYFSHAAPDFGYRYNLSFAKLAGNFQFRISQILETDHFDINDLGFDAVNNKFNNTLQLYYNIYQPFGNFLNWYNYLLIRYNSLYEGLKYTYLEVYGETSSTTKDWLTFGANTDVGPIDGHDYYEPRVDGWWSVSPAYVNQVFWISTDYRKPVAVDFYLGGYLGAHYKTSGFGTEIDPRVRFSDRFLMRLQVSYNHLLNEVGYVMDSTSPAGNTVIIYGRRDRISVVNVLSADYMFTSAISLDLRLRHYWASAPYYSYYQLQQDGNLVPVDYRGEANVNYNHFNMDLTFVWNFAPGSQVSFVWKNIIDTFNHEVERNYFNVLNTTLSSPAASSLSIRFLYYIDAMYFKKKGKRG
ncbi:MAG TPA: DUF5916 domain-containing protein [Bacteroidales bacterium]|nr:DUF5916 domain-containing protein [Bacteroidales bacterium]